jgi:DUF1680 family protein
MTSIDRREFLYVGVGGALSLALPLHLFAEKPGSLIPKSAQPFPLEAVRLTPSIYLDSVNSNIRYLHKVEPDRLLHNFRVHAGLKPKGEPYGGWERDTIAGHTLGHYLTACSLIHAHTGDEECKRRVEYIVRELGECQAQAPDGYVAGFTRRKDKTVENGRVIFEELKAGNIRSAGFDLNGCWVPFYNWHKLFAGLLDANEHCGSKQAIDVAVKLAGFIDGVLAKLNDEQVEKMLNCEHGGINESMAELYVRTNDKRWLALAERIRHKRTLGPMFVEKDELPNIHANTQIPKVIGLARLYEITGKREYSTAANFFWKTVTTKYTYAIGGNSDREYFQAPNTISKFITEQTCESCNTYNMLKLTGHLYSWNTQAAFFDYFERAHLNHIMAHQNPRTGMFAYMIPLMSGTARNFSSEFNDFWCCVGSGMESHSKHGESIYWQNGDHLVVNLFVPSKLDWKEKKAKVELATSYPFGEEITLNVLELQKESEFAVSMRLPYWCEQPSLKLNGKPTKLVRDGGYATIRRKWKMGDSVRLTLPMRVRIEPTNDDPNVIALMYGPMVLAADLGDAKTKYEGVAPALVGSNLLGSIIADAQFATFKTSRIGRPSDLSIKPFFSQWDRRTAVYFKRFTDAEWATEQAAYATEQARLKDLQERSVDVMHLGEMQPERDHGLTSSISYPVSYRGKHGRDARTGGFFEFKAKVVDEPLTLKATYWGQERTRLFHILLDGTRIASETLGYDKMGEFIERDYPIPQELLRGKSIVTVRFEPEKGNTAGPVFGVLIFRSK